MAYTRFRRRGDTRRQVATLYYVQYSSLAEPYTRCITSSDEPETLYSLVGARHGEEMSCGRVRGVNNQEINETVLIEISIEIH